jgi:hypothetical protein
LLHVLNHTPVGLSVLALSLLLLRFPTLSLSVLRRKEQAIQVLNTYVDQLVILIWTIAPCKVKFILIT